jgi:hypothetical protein
MDKLNKNEKNIRYIASRIPRATGVPAYFEIIKLYISHFPEKIFKTDSYH